MDRPAGRRDRLRRLVRQQGADAILVTNFVNVTYLTGFTGDDSYLLVTDKHDILMSDPRYYCREALNYRDHSRLGGG